MDNEMSIATIYKIFARKNELIQRFITLQNEYANEPRDYDNAGAISTSEVAILLCIEEHPGITTTELAVMHRKTKAALSQTVKKLEQRGLVYRERCPIDGKRALLHVNQNGTNLTRAHRNYDLNNVKNTLDELMTGASVEEIDAFFKVLGLYCTIVENTLDKQQSESST